MNFSHSLMQCVLHAVESVLETAVTLSQRKKKAFSYSGHTVESEGKRKWKKMKMKRNDKKGILATSRERKAGREGKA